MQYINGNYYCKIGWESFCWDVFYDCLFRGHFKATYDKMFRACLEHDIMPGYPLLHNLLDAAHSHLKKNPRLLVSDQAFGGSFTVRLAP